MTPCRIGLVASAGHRSDPGSALLRFIETFRPFFAQEQPSELFITGATHDALSTAGLLDGLTTNRLRPTREGGLITLTALLVGLDLADPGLDWIIYLQDPYDPTTLYPEAQALKRQCTVHGKPFLSTEAAASEWTTLEWFRRAPDAAPLGKLVERWVRPLHLGAETIGMIGHDAFKPALLEFAARHRPLLNRFGRRLATGTTGGLLNGTLCQTALPRVLTAMRHCPRHRAPPGWRPCSAAPRAAMRRLRRRWWRDAAAA